MNAQFRDRWVAALRSGKFEQGRYRLRSSEDKYCCLGVACEVARIGGDYQRGWDYDVEWMYDGHVGTLSYDVASALGIDGNHVEMLASMNDNGKSFGEIAAWIEENC